MGKHRVVQFGVLVTGTLEVDDKGEIILIHITDAGALHAKGNPKKLNSWIEHNADKVVGHVIRQAAKNADRNQASPVINDKGITPATNVVVFPGDSVSKINKP